MIRQKVYFLSAGPGAPDLITLRGRRLLDEADLVIYAGSLVNPGLLRNIGAEIYDSAGMSLEQITELMRSAVDVGKKVVRLHSGDIAFYSAISEQIERLRALGIGYELVPGVSSAMAGAALLGQELTIPELTQTVIFTRLAGRTPVPARESLKELARPRASLVIFLSVGMIAQVVEELQKEYPGDTPVVVIQKVSWPEEKVVRGTLADIAERVRSAAITKTALIYVGEALAASRESLGKESRLYHKDFKHGYRE